MLRLTLCLITAATVSATSLVPQTSDGLPVVQPRSTATGGYVPSTGINVVPAGGSFNVETQLHGVVRPSQMAELPSLVSGLIQQVHVKEGQTVRQGDPLVSLDDRVPRARLAAATVEANLDGALRRAQVDLKMAESRLARIRKVMEFQAGANYELEEAEGAVEQAAAAVSQQEDTLKAAEASRQLAEAQLHQFTITAPFDGVITELHIKAGPVDPTQIVVTVANLQTLEVEMHVPSQLYGKVQTGARVDLNAAAPISAVVQSTCMSVSPIINSASDTFRCLLKIDNSQNRLPAGFTVKLPTRNGSIALR